MALMQMIHQTMTKNMMDNLFIKFIEGIDAGNFLRVGNRDYDLFIGKDDEGRYCFEYRGRFKPIKIIGSPSLFVNQYSLPTEYILRFSLGQNDLIGCFSAFCEDLIDATDKVSGEEAVYQTLSARYQAWRKLFKTDRSKLSLPEVMGLIGELLFLKTYASEKWGWDKALDSWSGPEKTHKDFSCDNDWFEIKAINVGKETVHISSIEQLDSDIVGKLMIFSLEKMSTTYNGLTLNTLVKDIMGLLNTTQKDVFLNKLILYGYDFSPEHDAQVFDTKGETAYSITETFPRIKKSNLPLAITKTQYDIVISEIQQFKTEV